MNTPIVMQSGGSNTMLKVLGGAVVLGGGWFLWNRYQTQKNIEDVEKKIQTSPAGQQAMQLRAAFNPSGNNWMSSFDGTDNKALVSISKQIKDFGEVAESYRKLYKSNLSEDLTNEMSSSELIAFYKNIQNSDPKVKALLPQFEPGSFAINTVSGAVLYTINGNAVKAMKRLSGTNNRLKVQNKGLIIQFGSSKERMIQVSHAGSLYYVKQRLFRKSY